MPTNNQQSGMDFLMIDKLSNPNIPTFTILNQASQISFKTGESCVIYAKKLQIYVTQN